MCNCKYISGLLDKTFIHYFGSEFNKPAKANNVIV